MTRDSSEDMAMNSLSSPFIDIQPVSVSMSLLSSSFFSPILELGLSLYKSFSFKLPAYSLASFSYFDASSGCFTCIHPHITLQAIIIFMSPSTLCVSTSLYLEDISAFKENTSSES